MNTNHTPGPWHICGHDNGDLIMAVGDDEAVLATVYGTAQDEYAANARLIAAAPELFEACQQLLDYVEMTLAHDSSMSVNQIMEALKRVKSHTAELETYHHPGCPSTTRRVDLNAARAAIAKAKGQA